MYKACWSKEMTIVLSDTCLNCPTHVVCVSYRCWTLIQRVSKQRIFFIFLRHLSEFSDSCCTCVLQVWTPTLVRHYDTLNPRSARASELDAIAAICCNVSMCICGCLMPMQAGNRLFRHIFFFSLSNAVRGYLVYLLVT